MVVFALVVTSLFKVAQRFGLLSLFSLPANRAHKKYISALENALENQLQKEEAEFRQSRRRTTGYDYDDIGYSNKTSFQQSEVESKVVSIRESYDV